MGVKLRHILAVTLLLSACAFVDDFAPRQYDLNVGSEDALNEETLLNIVRASEFQPLNFVGVSQLTGGQSEQANIGLPTITFGPQKNAAAKEFALSGNVLQNTATGSFTVNPLISSTFQQALVSAVPVATISQLVVQFKREPVFYAVIDSMTLTITDGAQTYTEILHNDPANDSPPPTAPQLTCAQIFSGSTTIMAAPPRNTLPLYQLGSELYEKDDVDACSFSKFGSVLRTALGYGLTAEVPPKQAAGASAALPSGTLNFTGSVTIGPKDGATATPAKVAPAPAASPQVPTPAASSTASNTQSPPQGIFCFEPGLAVPNNRDTVRSHMQNVCGAATPPTALTFQFPSVGVSVVINLRSPAGVFGFLGSLLRERETLAINYASAETAPLKTGPFLNIVNDSGNTCAIHVKYQSVHYCVPTQGSANTNVMIQILQVLRNLSISPTDLNAPFNVRVLD
jgi:hypothetical protein